MNNKHKTESDGDFISHDLERVRRIISSIFSDGGVDVVAFKQSLIYGVETEWYEILLRSKQFHVFFMIGMELQLLITDKRKYMKITAFIRGEWLVGR